MSSIYPVTGFIRRFEEAVEQSWLRRWDMQYDELMDRHLIPHDICHPSVTDTGPSVRCRTHGGSYPGYGRCPVAPPRLDGR